jgi:23S rRNA (adenine2503-C2)-methyltransferase
LIPYNSGPELPFRAPPFERTVAFQTILTDSRIPTFIRISRGQDIAAACGQLSLEGLNAKSPWEREEADSE